MKNFSLLSVAFVSLLMLFLAHESLATRGRSSAVVCDSPIPTQTQCEAKANRAAMTCENVQKRGKEICTKEKDIRLRWCTALFSGTEQTCPFTSKSQCQQKVFQTAMACQKNRPEGVNCNTEANGRHTFCGVLFPE
jgi:hypothetical protein